MDESCRRIANGAIDLHFFSSLSPTGGLYDQRCVYDPINQRYIVIMEYGASGGVSAIDIAVSKDANPNDGWYFASLNTALTINNQLTASDRPMLSVDGTNIYITATQGSAGTECWVIGDTAGAGGGIYNGGTLTVTANQLAPSRQGVFSVVAGNNGKTYYALKTIMVTMIAWRIVGLAVVAGYDRENALSGRGELVRVTVSVPPL